MGSFGESDEIGSRHGHVWKVWVGQLSTDLLTCTDSNFLQGLFVPGVLGCGAYLSTIYRKSSKLLQVPHPFKGC